MRPAWIVLLVAVLAARVSAQAPDELARLVGGPIAVDPAIEPEVRAAFERAVRAIPEAHRPVLRELKLLRSAAPALPEAVPLVYRIWASAALAMYRNGAHEILVFDAAVRSGSPPMAAASRAEVYGLVLALGDALASPLPVGPDDPALDRSWAELAGRIARLAGRAAYDPLPPIGDPAVLLDLVRGGQEHMLGGRLELWQLLVHEIGHAVQLVSGDIEGWASLSGWWDQDGEPADGFVGGMFANERPSVAMRIALGADRGPLALYRPAPGARFPTPYASFDPVEDFAECYRFLVLDPLALARSAPGKFLAVNALGWSRTAGAKEPGPLRVPARALREAPWADLGLAGARDLLGSSAAAPLAAIAILRAHAEVFAGRAAELPMNAALPWPPDLPADLPLGLTPESFEARVGDVVLRPPPARVLAVLGKVTRRRLDDLEHAEVLERLTMVISEKRGEPPRTPLDHLMVRVSATGDLLRGSRRAEGRAAIAGVARSVRDLEQPAQRIVGWRALVEASARAAAWDDAAPIVLAALGEEVDPLVRAGELAGLALKACAAGRPDVALQAAAAITGPFLVGAEFRMQILLAVADRLQRSGDAAQARAVRARVRAAAAAAPTTGERDRRLEELARQETEAGDLEGARDAARALAAPGDRAMALGRTALALVRAGRSTEGQALFDEAWAVEDGRDEVARLRAQSGDAAAAFACARAAIVSARCAAAVLDPSGARDCLERAVGLLGATPAGSEREALLTAAGRAAVECDCADALAQAAATVLDPDARAEFVKALNG